MGTGAHRVPARVKPATVHRVLTCYGLARLAHLDRATGRVIRRYEHERPGDPVHVDIKKLGNIPDGGGHKAHGRAAGTRNSTRSAPVANNATTKRAKLGYAYLHNAIDDHSRLAYTEILLDETKESAAAFWTRARAFFAAAGVTVSRVLTDNGSCYRSHLFRDTLEESGIAHKRTRPYRRQTNGKVERYNRTLMDEWAYARPYASEQERRDALAGWLHTYNHHRAHTALGGQPPAGRWSSGSARSSMIEHLFRLTER
jgi:transposase InsO family protein